MSEVGIAIIGAVSGVIGSIIVYAAMNRSAQTTALPEIINSLSKRVTDQEKRIEQLECRMKKLNRDVETWKRNYFKFRKWVSDYFKKKGITQQIPDFHKEEDEL